MVRRYDTNLLDQNFRLSELSTAVTKSSMQKLPEMQRIGGAMHDYDLSYCFHYQLTNIVSECRSEPLTEKLIGIYILAHLKATEAK